MTDQDWMRLAIDIARQGMSRGQTPFGACIVRHGELVCTAHNRVLAQTDPSAHAEVESIRLACRLLHTIDLSGCTIYSTCEPCPMCFAACHWSRMDRIVHGADIADAAAAGFSELEISNARMKELSDSAMELHPHVLHEECARLFADWLGDERRQGY